MPGGGHSGGGGGRGGGGGGRSGAGHGGGGHWSGGRGGGGHGGSFGGRGRGGWGRWGWGNTIQYVDGGGGGGYYGGWPWAWGPDYYGCPYGDCGYATPTTVIVAQPAVEAAAPAPAPAMAPKTTDDKPVAPTMTWWSWLIIAAVVTFLLIMFIMLWKNSRAPPS